MDNVLVRGLKLEKIRKMTSDELAAEGWEDHHGTVFCLVFNNGTIVYASHDDEGNGPGILFGSNPQTGGFHIEGIE